MPAFGQCSAVVLWLLLVWSAFPQHVPAGIIGIYGGFSQYPIDAVFVSPKAELIAGQKEAGRQVYLTLNVFGGSGGWREFPDARPVRADGEFLAAALGGICPTHEGWRRSRLALLTSWLDNCRGASGIDGVWLDFIRYPGRWEQGVPDIPDTCYCPRCLGKFQEDRKIWISDEAKTVADKAAWIKANARLAWTAWKKEQVASFAREARQVVEQSAGDRRILLGAFLVPWRKSDYQGGLSFQLAQDAELLASSVDVLSPMVYHRMVERPVDWAREITEYYAEMTGRPALEVWPIIQAENVPTEEFGQVVQAMSRSSAQGLLVYTLSDMSEEQWPLLAKYQAPPNLLGNPLLLPADGSAAAPPAASDAGLPDGWFPPPAKDVRDSRFMYAARDGGNVIGLTAGYDRQAVWSSTLPDCRPGAWYLFSADFFREDRADSLAYPEVSLWGRTYRLNTHRMTGTFQRLHAIVSCPEEYQPGERRFQFRNDYPGNSFWLRRPKLVAMEPGQPSPISPDSDFFPIGIYGASAKNLAEIRQLGMNTAVIGMTGENIDACLSLGMRCTFAVAHDPEKLLIALDKFKPMLQKGRFSFYLNDEPEIHSFPPGKAEDIRRIIKQHFPEAVTNMAIVRPQAIPFYEKGADFFMLDQYPVPYMPMTWLSESMDEAAGHVGRNRLQSVIQAFGDDQLAAGGWPRLPTFEEMSCLAFLSVVHGSRGIYFFTFPSIAATQQGGADLARLVKQLNSLKTWLQIDNDQEPVSVRMTSANRLDPRGNPAVHCARKEQHNTQMLICVNTLGTHTEAKIDIPAERLGTWLDYYDGQPYLAMDGNLLARFEPYEVKVLLESR